MIVDYDKDQLSYALANAIKEREDALERCAKLEKAMSSGKGKHLLDRFLQAVKERDEALAKIKELIYIAERAIALAEIDFENDKFGVVSELRDDLKKIRGETK